MYLTLGASRESMDVSQIINGVLGGFERHYLLSKGKAHSAGNICPIT